MVLASAEVPIASLNFDPSRTVTPATSSARKQKVLKQQSPRLLRTSGQHQSQLASKSDDEVLNALLDNELSTASFVEYLQQQQGSPARLLPWLQTLTALAAKVGMLLESTRFLCCDLQFASVLMHMQTSAKALCGAKRALAFIVSRESPASLLRVGDKGDVLLDAAESFEHGTSFAAHCARSGEPLLLGPPGTPARMALHHNVDAGSGCRPETTICVPCLDHAGRVLAVLQVVDKPSGGSFGRDDLLLLRRFAVQCGISLRNATSTPTGPASGVRASTASAAEMHATARTLSTASTASKQFGGASPRAAFGGKPRQPGKGPYVFTLPRSGKVSVAVQCDDLLRAPPLMLLSPRAPEAPAPVAPPPAEEALEAPVEAEAPVPVEAEAPVSVEAGGGGAPAPAADDEPAAAAEEGPAAVDAEAAPPVPSDDAFNEVADLLTKD